MNVKIEERYELNQTASRGPVAPFSAGLSSWDHLLAFLFLVILFVMTALIVSYNLIVLHHNNPGYGRDLRAERAFCAELDRQIISSVYYWNQDEDQCQILELLTQGNF